MKIFNQNGQSLVELVLTIGVAALLIPAIASSFITSRQGKPQEIERTYATATLKETEKAVEAIRDNNWTTFANLSGAATWYPSLPGNTWIAASGTETLISGVTRQFVVTNVNRDASGNIVTSGGTSDPSTKKVDITISWLLPYSSSITSTMYLTRTTNEAYTDTTQAQFNAGSKIGTSVVVSDPSAVADDGQVQLNAGGGGGDWCQPTKSITQIDLPKSGVANAITAISGPADNESTVFAGTGDNSSGVSFAKVDVPGNPPSPTTVATFDGYKTNAVFGESGYAYLATDNNSKEIVIMSLTQFSDSPTNSKYLEVGTINLPGNVNADSVYVVNNKAYITSSNKKFYIYDVSSKSSPSLLNSGGLPIDGEGKKILVAGNYAYVATDSTTYQLEIVNISNSSSPSIVGKLNLGTGQSGIDVYVNTSNATVTRAYLVTSVAAGKKDFYIVNVSTPTAPTTAGLSSYDTGGMTPTGVTVVTGNRAIIVGTGGTYQYQVLNIANETGSLTTCANLAYATGVYGVASILQANGYAYSYIITGDASAELKIILGGAGGQFTTTGTFESATFDPYVIDTFSTNHSFNRLITTVSQPSNTTLKMQVAIATPVNNSCGGVGFTYVGPNGDPAQYFTPVNGTITALVPLMSASNYVNPGRCARYKVSFSTTDYTQSPIIYDATWNYSP